MTLQETEKYIFNSDWRALKPGLHRIRALLRRLGDPQKGLRFIHVAGTNGKGSICAMLESVLRAAGYRTGLFTSPHLHDFRERIRVNGTDISEAEIIATAGRVRAAEESIAEDYRTRAAEKNNTPVQQACVTEENTVTGQQGHAAERNNAPDYRARAAERNNAPVHRTRAAEESIAAAGNVRAEGDMLPEAFSSFERITAAAFLYFRERACDIVILETGMGGEFDATNVIDPPELAVLTNIGQDHTEILGRTPEEIAATKCGIIKTGSAVVSYDQTDAVKSIIADTCTRKGVSLVSVDFSRLQRISADLCGTVFTYKEQQYRINLPGMYQMYNAATAIECVNTLRGRGFSVSDRCLKEGLEKVKWPARMEVAGRSPLILVDGGHNRQCASALAESLQNLLPGTKAVFLIGVMADKDYRGMVETLAPCASEFLCVAPESERALAPEHLAAEVRAAGYAASAAGSVAEGLQRAIREAGKNGTVVVFGSLYLAAEARSQLSLNFH